MLKTYYGCGKNTNVAVTMFDVEFSLHVSYKLVQSSRKFCIYLPITKDISKQLCILIESVATTKMIEPTTYFVNTY